MTYTYTIFTIKKILDEKYSLQSVMFVDHLEVTSEL